jgi:phosphate-selective porin OprO/OprP
MRRGVLLSVVIIALAGSASAQSSGAAAGATAATTPQPAAQMPVAGWQNGFFLQTPNGDYRIQFGFVGQLDGRFSTGDPTPITNTFVLRKARPVFQGRVGRFFDFRVMTEFGSGTTTVLDAYVDTRFSTKFRFRAGKDKSPVGYEVLISDPALLLLERSLVANLLPNRDVGVQFQGDLAGGKIFYAGGVFNGVLDAANSTTDIDTNNAKDLAGRIVIQPFRTTATPPGAWNNFGFQVGGSTGEQSGALPVYRTSGGLQTWFQYAGASGNTPAATASGTRNRVTPAVFYYYKSFGAFAEYARSTQAVSRGSASGDVSNHAWDITAGYLLTGEAASAAVPVPRTPFDPTTGHWGAVQVTTRYAELAVDQAAFDLGFAASGASQKAKAFSIGLNWYPSQYIKYYVTYDHTSFEGPTPRSTENIVAFRVQAAF